MTEDVSGWKRGEGQCPHAEMHFNLNHVHLADSNIHYLEITGRCNTCQKAIAFRGAPLGLTPDHPTMALDGSEIRLPFLCGDEDPGGSQIGFVGRPSS